MLLKHFDRQDFHFFSGVRQSVARWLDTSFEWQWLLDHMTYRGARVAWLSQGSAGNRTNLALLVLM